jgi:hypothetical protein
MASIAYDVALILLQARTPADGIFGNDNERRQAQQSLTEPDDRRFDADDKRQAAELIGLDDGDLRRGPLDTRKAALTLLLKQAAPRPAAQQVHRSGWLDRVLRIFQNGP